MSDRELKAFKAIGDFVDALWDVHGTEGGVTPLALYRRLLEKITLRDTNSISRFVGGFRDFFAVHDRSVLENQLDDIPEGTCIYYGDNQRISIEIQKFLYRADDETREIIRGHLINISREIDPSPLKMQELQKQMARISEQMQASAQASQQQTAEPGSVPPEARLMQDLMGTLQENMGDLQNAQNPMEAVMKMVSNPAMIQGIGKTMSTFMAENNGNIDPMKMMMNMTGMMQNMMGPNSNFPATVEEQDDENEVSENVGNNGNIGNVQTIQGVLDNEDRQAMENIEKQLESVEIVPKQEKQD